MIKILPKSDEREKNMSLPQIIRNIAKSSPFHAKIPMNFLRVGSVFVTRCLRKKVTLRTATFEKVPCHDDFYRLSITLSLSTYFTNGFEVF